MMHRVGTITGSIDGLTHSAAALMGRLAWHLASQCNDFKPRQLSNTIWAMGNVGRPILTVRYRDTSIPEFYGALLTRIVEIDDFLPQEVANIIHGLAKMSFKIKICGTVLNHLTTMSMPRLMEFKTQELAASLWGLGHLQYRPGNRFLEDAIRVMTDRLESMSPRQMSNVLWAAARLEFRGISRELPKFERQFLRVLWNFNDQALSIVLWSFAKLNYAPATATVQKAFRVIRSRIDFYSPTSLANIAYSCAIFGDGLFHGNVRQLRKAFLRRLDAFSLQLMCIFVWSMAIMFELDLTLFSEIVQRVTKGNWKTDLAPSDKRQLYQSMIHVQFFVPGGNEAMRHVCPDLLSEIRRVWEEGQKQKWRDTVCLSVLMQLQKLGYAVQSQHEASKGLAWYSFEVIKKSNDAPIAMEVTISMHQFRNTKMKIEGPRQWAMELMKKQGFEVLQVDAEKWKTMRNHARLNYLNQLLEGMQSSHTVRN